MKIGVIGTGISGLSIANMLNSNNEVVLFEKNTRPGGLIKCDRVNDCLFHKVGGHVFNSKNKKVLDWFWSYFNRDEEFVKVTRNAKVLFNDKLLGYPIENYLYLLDKPLIKQITAELIELSKLPAISPFQSKHFEDFLQRNFGATLYEIYFKPYNEKIWRTDLTKVPLEWLEGKLPMPNLLDIIQSNILREEEKEMVHAHFFYPKENGSQFIVDRMKKDLTIQTGNQVTNIQEKDGKLSVEGQDAFEALVYCGDIRQLPAYCKELLQANGVDVAYLEGLQANGTSNLFCETDDNNISWLYIPQNFTRAHRIIYTGNFSSSNNRGSSRKTCVVEFSGKVDYEVMTEEIKKLPGNLHPLAFNYEPSSYVIQDDRTRKEIAAAKEVLKRHNIYLLGRFAEWEYYNMDKAIEAAFVLSDELNKQH